MQSPCPVLEPLTRRWPVAWLPSCCCAAAGRRPIASREVAAIEGVRSNQLTGFGLVSAWTAPGDQTTQMPYTLAGPEQLPAAAGHHAAGGHRLAAAQERGGGAGHDHAAARLRAARPVAGRQRVLAGQCQVAQGGTLIATALRGVDGEIYALAQGNLIVGGAGAHRPAAARCRSTTSAPAAFPAAPGGAHGATPLQDGPHQLGLDASDFQTARRVAEAINRRFGDGSARHWTAARCRCAPHGAQRARELHRRDGGAAAGVQVPAAKVVINSRTGSIVLNQSVTLGPCAIAHGNLSVSISSTPVVSQPNRCPPAARPWSPKRPTSRSKQEPGILIQLPAAPQLADVVRAQRAGRHAAGPAGDPAGHQGRGRASTPSWK